MKQEPTQPTIETTGQTLRRALLALGLTVAASALAQTLPTRPPSGYDSPNRYPAGRIERDISYYSSVAGRNLTMHVYTPPGYNPNQKYGVVYCYQGITDTAWHIFLDSYIRAHIVADNLIGEGKIKPIIIVALDDQFNGNNSNVEDMTIRDAIPFVDARYSTHADADHRGVYGYSWGGGYTFNVGCENLDVFRHMGPSAAAPNKHSDTTLFPNGGAEAKQKMKSLFISWGSADSSVIVSANRNARAYCQANGIPHIAWEVSGGNHTSASVFRPALWNFLQIADRAGISAGGGSNEEGVIQAESGVLAGGVTIDSNNAGFTGTGFANFPTTGGSLTFSNVDGSGGGTKSLAIRYANGATAARAGTLTVNGVVSNITFNSTGAWTTWQTLNVNITLNNNSTNTIRFASTGQDLGNIDQIKLPVAPPPPPATIQAETGVSGGGVTIDSNNAGFTGSGFANFPVNGGTLTFNNVTGNGGGTKSLAIRYALGATSSRTGTITVNGVTSNITFPPTGSWTTWATINVNVALTNTTTNTIRFASTGQDLGNLDQFTIP